MYFYDFIPTYKASNFSIFFLASAKAVFFWPEMDLSHSALPRALGEQNQINLASPFLFFSPCKAARKLTHKSDPL